MHHNRGGTPYTPPKIIMPRRLHHQPNILLPRKIHPLFHVFRTRSIHHIHRISSRAARSLNPSSIPTLHDSTTHPRKNSPAKTAHKNHYPNSTTQPQSAPSHTNPPTPSPPSQLHMPPHHTPGVQDDTPRRAGSASTASHQATHSAPPTSLCLASSQILGLLCMLGSSGGGVMENERKRGGERAKLGGK